MRPNYEDMNPFVTINDKYLYDQGNVELKPEISHQVETGLLFNNRYKVILFWSHTRHPICKATWPWRRKPCLGVSVKHVVGLFVWHQDDCCQLTPYPLVDIGGQRYPDLQKNTPGYTTIKAE